MFLRITTTTLVGFSLGAQQPTFEQAHELPDRAVAEQRWTMDLNSDGAPDFRTTGLSTSVGRFRLNDATAQAGRELTFSIPANYSSLNMIGDIATLDADQDGDQDVLIFALPFLLGPGPDRLFLSANDGSGNFTTTGTSLWEGPRISPAAVGDVDGDGVAEVIATSPQPAQTWLIHVESASSLRVVADAFPPGSWLSGSRNQSLTDFDNDGDLDYLAFGSIGGTALLENQGNGTFIATFQFPNGTYAGAAAHDFDGDGLQDIVLGKAFGPDIFQLWRNLGSNRFHLDRSAFPSTPSTALNRLLLADIDSDDSPEILAEIFGRTYLWSNDGSGQFTDIGTIWNVSQRRGISRLMDLDRDGDSDAIEYQARGNTLVPVVLKNTFRQLSVNDPTYGSTLNADVLGQAGEFVGAMIGIRREDRLLSNIGWLGVSTSGSAVWPSIQQLTTAQRRARFSLNVPNDPQLRGAELWVQAVHIDQASGTARMGNLARSTIR